MNPSATVQRPLFLQNKKYSVRPFFNPTTVFTMIVLAVLFVMAWVKVQEKPNSLAVLYLLGLIQITPFILCFTRMHYNFMAFILFNHFATYTISKYNQVVNLFHLETLYPETVHALWEMVICTVLMLSTYTIARKLFFYTPAHKERLQMLSLNRVQLLVVGAYVISLPLIGDGLPPMVMALYFAAASADMVLLLCSDSPGNETLAKYLRLAAYLSTFAFFVRTGFLSLVGNLATYLFITGCLQRNWRRIVIPCIMAVLGSAIQTVKAPYRLMLLENPYATPIEKMEVLSGLLAAQYLDGADTHALLGINPEEDAEGTLNEEEKAGLLHGFARLGDDSLERVLYWTPNKVPFWGGETYAALPYMFIPRLLWPDKPTRHIWNKFGKSYGYLSNDDNETSVAVSFLAEGYMNFGYVGLYFVALFVGIFVALVERISIFFLGGYFYFTYICYLLPVMQYSSDLSSMIMSVAIISGVLFVFRTQFIKMARKDEYS